MSDNPFAKALSAALEYAVVSRQVAQAGVGFAYREAPVFAGDSGWRFFGGAESDAFCADTANFDTVPLAKVQAAYPELAALPDRAEGAWAWDDAAQAFVPIDDWQPPT